MVDRKYCLLLVTNHPTDVDQLRDALQSELYQIASSTVGQMVKQLEALSAVDCVLLMVTSAEAEELSNIPIIKRMRPGLPILAVSGQWKIPVVVQAIKIGADEVCEFPGPPGDLASALDRVLAVNRTRQPKVADLIPRSILEKLNSEEARILHLLVQGRTTKEVGATLDVSIRTVHYRKRDLLRKLGVQNRSEAIELIRLTTGNLFGGLSSFEM